MNSVNFYIDRGQLLVILMLSTVTAIAREVQDIRRLLE